MSNRIAPCRDCTKRQIGCHANCADYAAFVGVRQAISDERQRDADFADYVSLSAMKHYRKMKKRDRR